MVFVTQDEPAACGSGPISRREMAMNHRRLLAEFVQVAAATAFVVTEAAVFSSRNVPMWRIIAIEGAMAFLLCLEILLYILVLQVIDQSSVRKE